MNIMEKNKNEIKNKTNLERKQTNQFTNKFLNMKKLFLLVAFAALGLASCTDEQIEDQTQKDGIQFKTMVGMNSIFKSTELNNTAFTEFWVSAYRTASDLDYDSTRTLIPYIDNLRVVKINQVTNEWNYTGNYYWPLSQKLNFFAHNAGASSVMPTTQFTNFPSFVFTQDFTSATTQKDVVIARALNQTQMATPVALTFNHVLTQINFSLKGADDGPEYVIKKIEVLGIRETGTFRFRDTLYYMWNTAGSPVKAYTYFDAGANPGRSISTSLVSFGNGSGVASAPLVGNEALMIIPQDGENLTIRVTYDVVNQGVTLAADAVATTLLTGERLNVGKKVRYNLTIPTPSGVATNRITFTGTVSDWNTEVIGGVTTTGN